jgi:hypothetical protein
MPIVFSNLRWVFISSFTTLLLWACGGGVGEEGTGADTPSVSIGVVEAISADAVRFTKDTRPYDVKAATVVDGFGRAQALGSVKRGMWVKVDGRASETAVGVDTVRLEPAVRGVVTDTAPLTVLGTQITAYVSTVIDGPGAGADRPQVGQSIEVHGRLGRPGEVEASRIELLAATDTRPFELRGLVRSVDVTAKTLVLEKQLISYASLNLQVMPAVGDSVRVASAEAPSGANAWNVTSLRLERPGASGGVASFYQQGFTRNFVARAGKGPTFRVEGIRVDAANAVVDPEVNDDNVCVIVLGELLPNGTLLAKAVFWNNLGPPRY